MIKFAKQIAEEIEGERKKKPINIKGYVTGEAFEKWLREKRKRGNNYDRKN